MTDPRSDFAVAYDTALAEHLAAQTDASLEGAAELGRRALSEDVSILDIVEHHVRHVAELSADLGPKESRSTQDAALHFLLQTLTPLDVATRGFAEGTRSYRLQLSRADALAELDAAKTRFFQNVSHEFRTPLTLMLGPLNDLLADHDVKLPAGHRSGLDEAQRAGQRLKVLVDALLDIARAESGELRIDAEPTDLAELTADCASMFRSAVENAGLDLVVDLPPLPEPVLVDRERWVQIVSNLLSNAVKFTASGTITISLRAVDDRLELDVADTGIGIPADELEHVFTRFHQVPDVSEQLEGAGIGLSLVRDLVLAHDGEVSVRSTPGEGTTFTVSIPLRTATTEARPLALPSSVAVAAGKTGPAAADQSASPDASQGSVLVVEDNPDLRSYITRLLVADGWAVHAVADAEAALRQAQHLSPDLVLSDIMLPGRTGLDLLRTIRAADDLHRLPVILLTARAGAESTVEGFSSGADDYIVKPFDRSELLARIRIHVELARLRDYALSQAENKVSNLRTALATNRQIGAAIGVIMATEKLTNEQAFERIRGVSQRTHRKLRDVADEVLYTGRLDA
ncbi:MAG TPA: ATP-binding protein [Jatrophihabitantaceae bacterium]|jgi:signal transduction histidine kinase/DNA-binding response OmpR family regulator